MKDSIKVEHPLIKLLGKLILPAIIIFYALNACTSINDRAISSVVDSKWASTKSTMIFNTDLGQYREKDMALLFTYEENKGFVKVTLEDERLLEFTHLNEGKMFCVTQNVMYYEIKN